jgi:amino acid adenylation domain-containing protein/non-ribosomal peptide synthase protein (TIGR01720 family)
MVPSVILVVNDVPMLPSGKLDRKQVATWVGTMSDDLYRQVVDIAESTQFSSKSNAAPATEIENKLRSIWSHVLNLQPDRVELGRSFMSLGGDSISAMQVKGQCSKKSINLSVQDILRSKSIVQLAQCATSVEHLAYREEMIEQNFSLSPIQHLYFRLPNQGQGHFNQSFFLRVTRTIHKKDLRSAIETIIQRHSMLSARFTRSSLSADWQQRITKERSSSYRLKAYQIAEAKQATHAIADSQTCLDVERGPLFAADLFDVDGQDQLLFMVAHHLVIDLVSWRIILEEIEDLLLHPEDEDSAVQKPVSFQTWCHMQLEDCQTTAVDKVLPVEDIPAGDASYWGMSQNPNTYGDVACEGFEVDKATTSMMLTECLDALHTEPVDILISALINSFALTFSDRSVPAIYNEGHGREPSAMSVDITRTVGWFTTMYPVHIPSSVTKDPIDTVKHVKDFRRKVPDNGRPYFASRCLTDEGDARFGHHWPLEVTFNYLGQYQQLEREGALLRPVDAMAGETRGAGGTADVGENTPRFGLFEISAVITQGKLRFSFTFNRHMKHQDQILQWISNCQQTIGTMAETLTHMKAEATIGDFPLLSLTYDDLHKLTTERLPKIGISNISDVQEIYPCSSMQEGLLISQTKSSAFYAVQVVSELQVASDLRADREHLANAWQQVVDRHGSLRTIFIESVSGDEGLYDQVVLKKVATNIVFTTCERDSDALEILEKKEPLTYIDSDHPPHRFTVCETSRGKIFCRLEISHAIMDGGSMSIIFRDLASAYQGLLPKGSGPLYSDYISYLQNQPSEASVQYWKTYLDNVEPCNFPILNDGRATAKELKSLRLDFTPSRFLDLQRFCDSNGVTFSNVLHTAWGLTLRLFSNSDEACFGYLTSGRDAPVKGIDEAVGPFINMLVCRVSTAPASRLGAVLDQVQKDYMDSLPHRNTSLAEVQHALHLSGTPLFNTALSYRRLPIERPTQTPKVSFTESIPTYDPTEYPISVNIEASDESAAIDLDYWTDYISNGQAANVGNVFLQCLQNIVHHSDATIERLNNFNEHHLDQVQKWNGNVPASINDCVHRVFQHQAHAKPGAPAICAWDAEFSYAELDQLSTKLAHHLAEMNIRPETFVPTCFDKSGWTIVAMLAVLKAGAAAAPLDATHPRSALELRVRDTEATIVLASPSRAELFEDMGVHVVCVSKDLLDQLPTCTADACPSVRPVNPCFIIYTSGSTGKPKGVVLEHRAIVTSAYATGTAYNWGPSSRVLQFASYTFDNSLAEIFFTLMRGGCVCVPSEHERFNDLAGAINRLKVNFMDITPTVASFLRPSDVPSVKGLSLGGEPLTKDNIETWGKAVALHCCYGPSECSVNSTWNGDLGNSSEATNIGKSIGSVSWIVDADNHNYLTPIGCVGELLIEGPILAREYLHDHEKTSKAFIKGPAWTGDASRRMYKTGDLARYNSDGTITYLGRKDTQVKLNGQRIELGEIEHHLKSNLEPEVQSAVELITMSGSQKATKALAAFFCMQSDGPAPATGNESFLLPMSDSTRELSTMLETAIAVALPAYMVPTIYIPVSSMPMTSSGKLDRRTLRTACHCLSEEQAATYRLARKSGRPPTTEVEKLLAELWESVLNLERNTVGADDNFFRVGGDSIGAMKLITAARVKGVSITVANIFQHPKLSELSTDAILSSSTSQLQAASSSLEPFSMIQTDLPLKNFIAEVASDCQVDINSICDIYPCTAIQEGLIALSNKDPGAYVAQNIYRLPANINLDRFCEAWQKVFQAEVILRTRVVYTKSSGFLQVVVREQFVWNRATNLQAIIDQDRQLPAYNGGPLSSYTIVEEAGEAPHFVWTSHHALYDGWCIPLMLERVEACYCDFESINSVIGVAYPRFIKYLTEIDSAESDNFWKTKLSDTTAATFPALPNPAYQVHATSTATHKASLTRAAGTHITLPSTVRAAWALVISTYSGNAEDVVFGETLTGRDAPVDDIADMIGPTLATVPTRIRINSGTTVGRFLEDVQTLSAEAIPFQYSGLPHIKHLSEDTSTACNFQNLLAVHHEVKEPPGGFWDLRSSGTVGTNFYSYPLTVSCQLGDGSVEIDAHYDENVISTWLVEKMLAQFDFILQYLNSAERMNDKLGEIKVLNEKDQAMILNWNGEPIKAVNECVHHLIEKQVMEQPESTVAVDSWDETFTYSELDQLSTRLGQHLVACGIKGSLVPLCFEKSAWTIVAMLAVLKAGGAFVPLDPAAPVARLRDIIGDTEARFMLCSPKYYDLCSTLVSQAVSVERKIIGELSSTGAELPAGDCNAPAYLIFTSGSTGKPKYVLPNSFNAISWLTKF